MATSDRLSGITNPACSFTYDNAGNVSQESQYTATYNVANRLASLTKAGVTTTYTYNERGQRVRKSNSAGTTIFVYDSCSANTTKVAPRFANTFGSARHLSPSSRPILRTQPIHR